MPSAHARSKVLNRKVSMSFTRAHPGRRLRVAIITLFAVILMSVGGAAQASTDTSPTPKSDIVVQSVMSCFGDVDIDTLCLIDALAGHEFLPLGAESDEDLQDLLNSERGHCGLNLACYVIEIAAYYTAGIRNLAGDAVKAGYDTSVNIVGPYCGGNCQAQLNEFGTALATCVKDTACDPTSIYYPVNAILAAAYYYGGGGWQGSCDDIARRLGYEGCQWE